MSTKQSITSEVDWITVTNPVGETSDSDFYMWSPVIKVSLVSFGQSQKF